MSWVDTRADIPVSHSEQNKLHAADRESKHKHGPVGEISRADSRRRWNNLQQARPLREMGGKKGAAAAVLANFFTPAGWVHSPKKQRTHLNSNIPYFLPRSAARWNSFRFQGTIIRFLKDKRLRRQWNISNPAMIYGCPPTMSSSKINQFRSFFFLIHQVSKLNSIAFDLFSNKSSWNARLNVSLFLSTIKSPFYMSLFIIWSLAVQ